YPTWNYALELSSRDFGMVFIVVHTTGFRLNLPSIANTARGTIRATWIGAYSPGATVFSSRNLKMKQTFAAICCPITAAQWPSVPWGSARLPMQLHSQ